MNKNQILKTMTDLYLTYTKLSMIVYNDKNRVPQIMIVWTNQDAYESYSWLQEILTNIRIEELKYREQQYREYLWNKEDEE